MEVLLINANREMAPTPVVPLGLAYVAEAAEKAGHRVKVMDLCFAGSDYKILAKNLKDRPFQVIGISIRNLDNVDYYRPIWYLAEVKELVEFIKGLTDSTLVVGGSGFSIMPAACLKFLGCPLGIRGPGEEAFSALLNGLENNEDLSQVPGLVTINGPSEWAKEPSYGKSSFGPSWVAKWVVLERYLKYGSPIPIQAKRGCHFKCAYCTYPKIEGHEYRRRDPGEVAEEIQLLAKTTGSRNFEMVDSTFNSLEEYAKEICLAIIRLGLKVSLQASGITPASVSPELVELMKRAGFNSLVYTPDSGSDVVLEALRKGFTVSQVDHAAGLLRRAGFQILWCFILGGPGESEETLKESFQMAEKWAGPGDAIVLTLGVRIYPGTGISQLAKASGLIQNEDDLIEPRFYISPDLDRERLLHMVEGEVRTHPRYILVKDAQLSWLPHLRRASTFLGQAFPLWKYASPINRLRNLLGTRV